MLFGGNYHFPHAFLKNQKRGFEGKELLLLNTIPTRFAAHFLQMVCTLRLKDALRETVHLQEFI